MNASYERTIQGSGGWTAACGRVLGATLVLAVVSSLATAQSPPLCTELHKLTASDGSAYDYFGRGVAVSGGWAVVGASQDDPWGSASGSAYVYRYDPATNAWAEFQKLVPLDGAAGDEFGQAVAIDTSADPDVIVIGAYLDDHPSAAEAGSAYVFEFDGSSWVETQKLVGSLVVGGDQFGVSVSVSAEVLIVGAFLDNTGVGAGAGSAYVFRRHPIIGWQEEQYLTAPDGAADDLFGGAVSVRDDVVIVGAPLHDHAGSNAGAAYVFRRLGGLWVDDELLVSDAQAGDQFGISAAIDGNLALVGADSDDDRGSDAGSAYVFEYDGSSWNQLRKLLASNGAAGGHFGYSVSLSGSVAVVGEPFSDSGAAYLYHYIDSTCIEEWLILASDINTGDYYGQGVAVSGDRVIVGSTYDDDKGSGSGSAYIFGAAEFELLIFPDSVAAGQRLDFSAFYGKNGHPVLYVAVAVNGIPVFASLPLLHFGGNGKNAFSVTVPPGFSGLTVTFQALKLSDCRGVVASNTEDVIFL